MDVKIIWERHQDYQNPQYYIIQLQIHRMHMKPLFHVLFYTHYADFLYFLLCVYLLCRAILGQFYIFWGRQNNCLPVFYSSPHYINTAIIRVFAAHICKRCTIGSRLYSNLINPVIRYIRK